MLVIRMQRTGRSGHAQFRVVVQDSRRTPTSGKIVAQLGHYDPHSKQTSLNKEKAEFYLSHGAQPSDRVARLLKSEGVKLPKWVSLEAKKKGAIRNPDKLRRNRPAGAEAPVKAEEPTDITEAPAEAVAETAEAPAETAAVETTEPAAEGAQTETSTPVESPSEAEVETAAEPQVEADAETETPKDSKS